MDARIVEFAEVLRQNGVRVGTSEVVDATQAVAQLGLERRDVFRSALRSTLVKRGADTEVFDRAFEFFFLGATKTLEGLDTSLLQALEADRAGLAKILAGSMLELNLVGLESQLQSGFFARRLLAAAGGDRAWADLKQIEAELKARGISAAGLQLVSQRLSQAMRKVEGAVRREVEREVRARMAKRGSAIVDRPLHTLSVAEVERMKEAVRRLAQKLKSRLIRRARSSRRGVLHVRRTLRRNLTWGAIH